MRGAEKERKGGEMEKEGEWERERVEGKSASGRERE